MIWQFTRRDPAWLWVAPVTFAFVAALLVWHFFGDHDRYFSALVIGCMSAIPLVGLFGAAVAQEDYRSFQAILPVTVRQIFAVRIMAAVTMLWLPFAAGAGMLFALGDSGTSEIPLRMWLLVTCIELAVQCATIRGVSAQVGLPLLPLAAGLGSVVIAAKVRIPFTNPPAENLALVCCWVLCAALIARTWFLVPNSVQLEPRDASPATGEPARRSIATGGTPWKAVLLTFFPPMSIFRYLYSFLWMSLWYPPMALVFAVVGTDNWTSARTRFRWTRGLPVSPRAMWMATLLPGILSMICGCLADIRLPFIPRPPHNADLRTRIVTIIFIAALSLLWNLAAMAVGWRPVGRRRVLRWAGLALLLSLLAGQIFVIVQDDANPVRWLSQELPASWLGIIGIAILPLFALLAAMDLLFRQLEFL